MFTSQNESIEYTRDSYSEAVAKMMAGRRRVTFDSGMLDLVIVQVAKEADNFVEYKNKSAQISSDKTRLYIAIVLLRMIEEIFAQDIRADELEKLFLTLEKVKYFFKNNVISDIDFTECYDLLNNFKRLTVCQQYELARENVENAINASENDVITFAAENVLKTANLLIVSHKAPIADVTSALVTAIRVVERPYNDDAISELQQKANHMSQRNWGRMLAGTMLALAGVAMAVGFTATALISFGVLAPVSILGFTLGASMLAGGFAVAGGVVGLGGAAAGAGFFVSGAKQGKEVQQLHSSVANLAKTAKRA